MKVGTLQANALILWLYDLRGSGVKWCWVSVSWHADMAG
jgi:hypothetical protein